MELVAAGWCARIWFRFDQIIGNLACGASAGSKWIEKDKVIYLLDLFEGRGEKELWDLVCGASLDHWANASLC